MGMTLRSLNANMGGLTAREVLILVKFKPQSSITLAQTFTKILFLTRIYSRKEASLERVNFWRPLKSDTEMKIKEFRI